MTPSTSRAIISIGTHFGLSFIDFGIGGVYLDEELTPVVAVRDADEPEELPRGAFVARGSCPGLVPLGVTRLPPVLRFGGATSKRV